MPNKSRAPLSTWAKRAGGGAIRRAPEPVRRFVARFGGFLARNASGAGVLAAPPVPAAAASSIPDLPLPVPPGIELADLRAMLESLSVDGSADGALAGYVGEAFGRFLRTLELVRGLHGTILELGAGPYFQSVLLQRYTDLDLIMANFFGTEREGTITQSVTYVDPAGEKIEQEMVSHLFNIEEDQFPYESDTFDVVLFCEILEHLLMNPVAVLREIRRVVKPGGMLVLTTPNVNRLENVFQMVEGKNIYDPYSGYGSYGRHNREYTRGELEQLLAFTGFDVETSFTANSNPPRTSGQLSLDAIAPLVAGHVDDLGQYLFVRARASSEPRAGLPRSLFRSYPEEELTDFVVAPPPADDGARVV